MSLDEIVQFIKKNIANGVYEYGTQIPSERELSRKLNVNRSTIKIAIDSLATEGYLKKVRGSGNYVIKHIHDNLQVKFKGFSEMLTENKITPSNIILGSEIKPAGYKVAKALNIQSDEPVFHFVRLRVGNGEPISIENTYSPMQYFKNVNQYNLEMVSFYSILAANNVQIKRIFQTVFTTKCQNNEARILKTEKGSPVLSLQIQAIDVNSDYCEFTEVVVLPQFADLYTKNFHHGLDVSIYAQID